MKFYIACIQKIYETVKPSMVNSTDEFVACPSLRVFESSDFKFLSGKDLTQNDFLNSEDVSMQFNSISNTKGFWDIDPNLNLFDLYKSRIAQLKTKNKTILKNELKKDFDLLYNSDESETETLQNYNEKLAEYDDLLSQFESLVETFDSELTDDEKKALSQRLDVIDKKIGLHIALWKLNGLKDTVDNALSRINHLNEFDQFLVELKNIRSHIQNAESTGIQSLTTFSKTQIVPYDFYSNDFAWSSLEVLNTELNGLFSNAKKNLVGFNEGLLDFEYEEDFIEKVTLKYCLINIKRPWFKPDALLHDFVEPIKTKSALYAKKIVLIKDLRVILKEDLTSVEKSNIQKNSIIKFGPIFMKSQLFKNKTSRKDFIKPITNKKLYKANIFSKIDAKIMLKSPRIMAVNPKLMAPALLTKSKIKMATNKKVASPKALHVNMRPIAVNKAQALKQKSITAKPQLAHLKLDPKKLMFHTINWTNITNQSNVHFTIKDNLTNEPLYKSEISIQNRSTNFYKEIETDESGKILVKLPKGGYNVSIRKNGFKELTFTQIVQETKNLNILKKLVPEEIVYDSYFLMGIIGEQVKL
ncbi:carboxypeptidase regulatory-like domain-containing protein [Algibacter amylolyticus]|uniref:Carboxypeptidase regulatory-like domain-containing protein n=1 Tax=Algibacter amylolyticus TaxID=1608400 RepID=A0A5M7AXY2_9FLAO|nr:carboxypeptidase-like regulatory domain-containing protein [Algibacter amylolyticus]KAA5822293.1 carboxypeptidase regulatory-like domain-containing protein [Algibacter amylolyticus]MBB5269005.1 hypothetical protein [Algibacter amylolyticus]TSJ73443.1 carboxypeptidase regulatory-like domain-containing protein [Algibacter amylolyticus]